MNDWLDAEGQALWERLLALTSMPFSAIGDDLVDDLGCAIFAWQRTHNPVLDRVATSSLGQSIPRSLAEIPALPTDIFKIARVSCFPERATVRVFETSGTTQDVRGSHAFANLGLYASAAGATAARWLLPQDRYQCVFLAEAEATAPASSLSFMLGRFADRWHPRSDDPWMIREAVVDVRRVVATLARAWSDGLPVALLGTSFGFIHLLDALGELECPLVEGSVAMPTGGFKGRSREIDPLVLRTMIGRTFRLKEADILGEYGMTELSSQGYEARREGSASYRVPPWMRVTIVDAGTLQEVPWGELGLVRVVDLMNLGSAIAIQTSDLGRMDSNGRGFVVLGRAPGATPRGCARAMDAVLVRR